MYTYGRTFIRASRESFLSGRMKSHSCLPMASEVEVNARYVRGRECLRDVRRKKDIAGRAKVQGLMMVVIAEAMAVAKAFDRKVDARSRPQMAGLKPNAPYSAIGG